MINKAQVKCLAVFAIFAVIGFGPISPGCLIGLYIIWKRPKWFKSLVYQIYNYLPQNSGFVTPIQTHHTRIKSFLSVLILFIIDIAPIPVTPVFAVIIILIRPMWFYATVCRIYGRDGD